MKSRKKVMLTIKREIFLLSFAFLAIVALIFSSLFLWVSYKNNMDGAKNSLRVCNGQIVTYTEGMFHENASILNMLAKNTAVLNAANGDSGEALSIFNDIYKDNRNVTYVYAGYENGALCINDYDVPDNFDPTARPWYQEAKKQDGVAKIAYSDVTTGEWLFGQSKRLVDSKGNMVGAVCIDCSNESISEQLSARYQYESQRSYIMNEKGEVLIHPEKGYINDSILNYADEHIWKEVTAGKSNYTEYKKNGVKSMVYFERIPETEFIVATAIDASEIRQPFVRGVEVLVCLLAAISVALGVVLSRVLIYRFAGPVMRLKTRLDHIADGCVEEFPEISFPNEEISEIANSIEVIVKDIAKREEKRKAAEYLSFHDSMTGLYNRRFFEEEERRMDVRRNYPLCIMSCDINGLKLVNDVFGHDVGDLLIIRVVECMKQACRADDILARFGGDEFVMLFPGMTEVNAQGIILRMQKSFAEKQIFGAEVSASVGYGIKKSEEESMVELGKLADEMMYTKKRIESVEMRQHTVSNIIKAAKEEGFVKELTEKEEAVCCYLAKRFCEDEYEILKQSYWLRNIGLCTLLQSSGKQEGEKNLRHTENGYRLLSATEEYRGIAGHVLHYTEHWDGSGWPVGLAGRDIPQLSRVLAVVDAWSDAGGDMSVLQAHHSWYDFQILGALSEYVSQ